MQMELLKKPIRSYRTLDIRETEEMQENSIIVPDSKPDVKNILLTDAESFVTHVEKSGRLIEVSGEIRYKILYLADTPDQRLECIITKYPWSISVQKPKTEGEIGIFAKSRCQHIQANPINGRKIIARTVISLLCRFYELKSDEIGREILGEDVFLKTVPLDVVTLRDNGDINAKVSTILSLPHGSPAIKEILFSRVNIGNGEVSYKDEDVNVEAKGTLNLLYRSDTMDESIESVVLEFPVKTPAGVQASSDNMVFTSSVLRNWEIEPLEDNDGLNTQLSVNLEFEIEAQALVHEEQTIIEDAYSIDYNLSLNKTNVTVITDEREFSEVQEVNQRIRLEMPEGRLEEVLMVCANERNIISNVADRSINLQGTVGVDIIFLNDAKQINSHNMELPFAQTFILPNNANWQVIHSCFSIEDVGFDISGGDGIELCIKLKVKSRACKLEEVTCTDNLNVSKCENVKKPPITLYFAQPNDSLWSIAKHYRIPVSRLAADNNIDINAKPEVGKRLFIMC